MLSGRQTLPVIVAQALIAFTVLTAATFLSYSDKLEGEAVTALFGMAIALAGQTASSVAQSTTAPVQHPTRVTTRGVTVETNGVVDHDEPTA